MPKPHVFVAVYVGDTIADARIVAASADPQLVSHVAAELLQDARFAGDGDSLGDDPITAGRRRILQLVETGGGEC